MSPDGFTTASTDHTEWEARLPIFRVRTHSTGFVRHRLWEHPFTDKRKFSSGGHNFEYSFTSENDGTIKGFTVDVRPQQYGISGIRSYLAVATIDLRT